MKKIILGITVGCLCLSSFDSFGWPKFKGWNEWRAGRQQASFERQEARKKNVLEAVDAEEIAALSGWFTAFENHFNTLLISVDQLAKVTGAHLKAKIDPIVANKKNASNVIADAKQIFSAISRKISGTEWNKASASLSRLNLDVIVNMLTDINNLIETARSIEWGNVNTKQQSVLNKSVNASEMAKRDLEEAINMYNYSNMYLSEAMRNGTEDLTIVIKGCQSALARLATCVKNAQRFGIKAHNILAVVEKEAEERVRVVNESLDDLESKMREIRDHMSTIQVPEVKVTEANNQQAMVVKHFIDKINRAMFVEGDYSDGEGDHLDAYKTLPGQSSIVEGNQYDPQSSNAIVKYQGRMRQNSVAFEDQDPSTGTVPQKVDRIERRIAAQRRVVGRGR